MTKSSTHYTLPNGLAIEQHRPYETDFVYNEVFVEQIYTRAFNNIASQPCVIDVGANIGLFSLFIKQQFPKACIYAFEPAPVHFGLLQKNLSGYEHVRLFQQGVGDVISKRRFTYYPNYSVMSGFHANPEKDRQLLAAGIAGQLNLLDSDSNDMAERYIDVLLDNKLDDPQHFDCPITTLSMLISEHGITNIDLLKIDAEKAELDVVRGIDANDWQKIKHIVLEAHDSETAQTICELLVTKNFHVEHKKCSEFKDAAIFIIYATHLGA